MTHPMFVRPLVNRDPGQQHQEDSPAPEAMRSFAGPRGRGAARALIHVGLDVAGPRRPRRNLVTVRRRSQGGAGLVPMRKESPVTVASELRPAGQTPQQPALPCLDPRVYVD